ncbi:hypothetical protein F3J20_16860, partial [Paraburkholderia sp. Cy-641]|nr:hypothetical protein [Paraburkholderia sp. Cy-641]
MNSTSASRAERFARIRRSGASRCLHIAGLLLGCALAATGGFAPVPAAAASADGFAEALTSAGNSVTTRTVALRDLGVRDVAVLDAPRASREYYFPVPAGVPLDGAELQVD